METLNFTTQFVGKYDFENKYVVAGADFGAFYHNLIFYDVFLDQDFAFIWHAYIGSPYTKTKIYVSSFFGWKNTTVFEVASDSPFLTDYFENYDFGISQEIYRTSWQLGLATYSFFRYDLRFIPEIYLKGKFKLFDNLSIISNMRLQFSDVSNATCHPEYFSLKAGIEWNFLKKS